METRSIAEVAGSATGCVRKRPCRVQAGVRLKVTESGLAIRRLTGSRITDGMNWLSSGEDAAASGSSGSGSGGGDPSDLIPFIRSG